MDGWEKGEREMYFIVVFSNMQERKKRLEHAESACLEERKEREEKRERERKKRKKRKLGERASGMDENREASALRRGYIYGERLNAGLLGVRFFFVLFSLCLSFSSGASAFSFHILFTAGHITRRLRQRRCYDYFESSIITFPSWPRTNITTTGIFRYLQTNIR